MADDLEQAIERAAKSINKAHEYVEGWRSRGRDAYAAGNAKVGAFRLDSADYLEEMAGAAAALVRVARKHCPAPADAEQNTERKG